MGDSPNPETNRRASGPPRGAPKADRAREVKPAGFSVDRARACAAKEGMSALTALLAFAAAAQPAPRGPVPADTAPAWTFTGGDGVCSAKISLAGGARLELGFYAGPDENYFGLSDPAWPQLGDGASAPAALRFAPGEEEAVVATATRSPRWPEGRGISLHPTRGRDRLRRIGRFGTFELVVGERRLGTYVLPQAEAGVARLLACPRATGATAGAPSGPRQAAPLNTYFSTDDYPRDARRLREQGTVGFSVLVGADGRVTDCVVTSSSGSASLDAATCRIVRERARYRPARDPQGNAVAGREDGLAVTWSPPPG
jgi:TonB family protein